MMVTGRIFRYITIVGVCCIVFVCGCPQPEQPETAGASGVLKSGAVRIAIKPTVGQQSAYRITEQKRRNIKWEGPVPEKAAFEESFNEEKVEMVVTQRIQSVDPNGKTVAKVTFDSLKYDGIVKNVTTVDFDSSRESDKSNVLNKLLGKSYMIEFGPDNTIIRVTDLDILRQMFSGYNPDDRAAKSILLSDAVAERHSMLFLPQTGDKPIKPGGTWSKIKTFSFGLMGIKSYEKIYRIKEVRNVAGHQIAIIEMNAIPSAEVEDKFRSQQEAGSFPKMFDTNDLYVGGGEIDLTTGAIKKYSENLHSGWMAALPSNPGQGDPNEPVVLRMTAIREYSLEMIQ